MGRYIDRRTGKTYDELPEWAMKVSDAPEEYQKEYYSKYGSSTVQPNASNQLDKADAREVEKVLGDRWASQFSAGNILQSGLFNYLNLVSPSQILGAVINATQGENSRGVTNNDSWLQNFLDNVYQGNSGFVSDKFSHQHPIATMFINGAGDAAASWLALGANNVLRGRKLETYYTGVPHKEIKGRPGVYMDKNFDNYDGTIWASDQPDYARTFGSHQGGKEFKVVVDPRDIDALTTPKLDKISHWDNMPFILENGKYKFNPEFIYENRYDMPDGTHTDPIYSNIPQEEMKNIVNPQQYLAKQGKVPLKSDDIVQESINQGKNATRMYKVSDGPLITAEGKYYFRPINELVLNPGAPHYKLNLDQSKWSILNWNFKSPYAFGLNGVRASLNNEKD